MKKLILLSLFFSIFFIGQAQVSKTIDISTAGTLSTALTANELSTVTNLTLTGTIDARDFKTMRNNMPALSDIDLSGVSIVAYTGTAGTSSTSSTVYPANEIPANAYTSSSLKSIVLPNAATSIGSSTFSNCTGLTSITIPASVNIIGSNAFSNCTGLTSITIPSSVSSIGDLAFYKCGLINVDNGNPNYSSQEGVLYNKLQTQIIQCPTVKSGIFSIPASVTSIGNFAFYACTGLTSITLPATVNTIGDHAFSGCSGLTSITLPASVNTIGSNAFYYCTGLTSIIIPASVNIIGGNAFYNCTGLTSITIPASVISIGDLAFYKCGLINVDNGNPNYSSLEGVLYNKLKTQLIQFPALKTGSFSIPNSVTLIGVYAFLRCTGLTSITIPASVNTIRAQAFNNCSGLTSIYAKHPAPVDLTNEFYVFSNINKSTCTLYVPQGSKAAYKAAYQWQDFTNIVENNTTVSKTLHVNTAGTLASLLTAEELVIITNLTLTGTIDARDFVTMRDAMLLLATLDLSGVNIAAYTGTAGTYNTNSIVYPANEIPQFAFYSSSKGGKSSLTKINLPLTLTLIGNYAFYGCSGLTGILNISSLVTTIGDAAFYGCNKLTSVSLPAGLTTIGNYAFRNCSGLTGEFYIPSLVTTTGNYAFYGCNNLTSVSLPAVLTTIGNYAFYSCSGLTGELNIPSLVTTIGEFAFNSCSNLTNVSLPAGLTTIGNSAFRNCYKLTNLSLPAGLTTIVDFAFFGCKTITNFTIPSSVTSIGQNAFSDCSNLTDIIVQIGNLNYSSLNGVFFNLDQSILIQYPEAKGGSYAIPSSVTSIGNSAFNNCAVLTSITIPNTVTSIGSKAFSNCSSITSITIPISVTTIGSNAFYNCSGLSSIYSKPTTPINLSSSSTVFSNVNKTTCTIYVPYGSKNAYQAANQWKDFTNIVENFAPDPVSISTTINSDNISLNNCTYCDITIEAGGKLVLNTSKTFKSITITPTGQLEQNSGQTLNITSNLTINSNSAGKTGTFVDNGTTNVTGTTSVNQFLGTARNWYVSSPVSSTASTITDISKYFEYIEDGSNTERTGQPSGSTNYWKGYTPGATFMTPGKGYIALPSTTGATLTFSGTLNNGNVNVGITSSGNRFNLIGNPYPCHIEWTSAFASSKSTQIEPSIYVRTNSGGSNSSGWSFVTYNAINGQTVPNHTILAGGIIPPMQAFWVRAVASAASPLVLNSDLTRSHQISNPLKASALKNANRQVIRLEVSNGTRTDETMFLVDANAADGYDAFDSPKYMEANSELQIYTSVATQKLVMNGMKTLPLDQEIGIGFIPGSAPSFSIKANEISNLPSNVNVILKDNATMTETDLTDGVTIYKFSPVSISGDRFSVIFRTAGVSTDVDNTTKKTVQVFVNTNNQIVINSAHKAPYSIYNTVGQLVKNGVINSKFITLPIANETRLNSGVYIVKVANQSTRVIIK